MSNQNNVSVNMENLSSQERDQLLALIEKANKKPVKSKMFLQGLEKPPVGKHYYKLYSNGDSGIFFKWDDDLDENMVLNQGNIFLFKEDAELVSKARAFKQRLRKACSDSWGDVEIDWTDGHQKKYSIQIHFNACDNYCKADCCWSTFHQVTPYLFRTREHVQQFIDDNKGDMHLLFVE